MTMTLIVDECGCITIPQSVLDDMQLVPGDSLAIELRGEALLLRPLRNSERVEKE